MDNKLTKVGILGGSGFTGEELLRILSNHSRTEVIAVSSRELLGQSTNKIVEGSNLSFIEPDNDILSTSTSTFDDDHHFYVKYLPAKGAFVIPECITAK